VGQKVRKKRQVAKKTDLRKMSKNTCWGQGGIRKKTWEKSWTRGSCEKKKKNEGAGHSLAGGIRLKVTYSHFQSKKWYWGIQGRIKIIIYGCMNIVH